MAQNIQLCLTLYTSNIFVSQNIESDVLGVRRVKAGEGYSFKAYALVLAARYEQDVFLSSEIHEGTSIFAPRLQQPSRRVQVASMDRAREFSKRMLI